MQNSDTQNHNCEWINFVDNKEAIFSLYHKPPLLDCVYIKAIDFDIGSPHIWINFCIDQKPDIVPKRGLWHNQPQTNNIYISFQFNAIENIQFDKFSYYGDYNFVIRCNPDFVAKTVFIDNAPVFEKTDLIFVKLSNHVSRLEFTAYSIRICSIRPMNEYNRGRSFP
jgi:hypothetical protein